MNLIFLLVFLLPLGLGGTLLFRGVRGFRVGDHPVCRRCGFDLFGQPAGTVICGECGTSLTTPGSVVIGHRQRRSISLLASVLLVSIGLFGITEWTSIQNIQWRDHIPIRYLTSRGFSENFATRSWAMGELIRRNDNPSLNRDQWNEIENSVLAYESDQSAPIESAWGDLMRTQQAKGHLSSESWSRYVEALYKQASSAPSSRQSAALADLASAANSRLNNSGVAPGLWDRAIDCALFNQRDANRPWDSAWGEIIEQARVSGFLPNTLWHEYAAHSFDGVLTLQLRPQVRRGDPMLFVIKAGEKRIAKRSQLDCTFHPDLIEWVGFEKDWHFASPFSFDYGARSYTSLVESILYPPGAVEGMHKIRVLGGAYVETRGDHWVIQDFMTLPIDLTASFELVAKEHQTVRMIHDPKLADSVKRSLSLNFKKSEWSTNSSSGRIVLLGSKLMSCSVVVTQSPTPLSFDVAFKTKKGDIAGESFACPADNISHTFEICGYDSLTVGDVVDVVFHANPLVAASTLDQFEAWDGDIVLKDVVVK